MKRRTTHRRAFSLIELLLVMVILAVLAAVIVPRFTGRGRQARVTAAQTDIRSLQTALTSFEAENDRFPTEAEGLDALINEPADVRNWNGPYLERIPADPWGNKYVYICPGKRNTDYDLYSFGPNGQEGDDDDIGNWTDEDK